MSPTFKKFLIQNKQFAVLTESLKNKWSLTMTAKKIPNPQVREQALELVDKLKEKAVKFSQNRKCQDFIIDNDLDK